MDDDKNHNDERGTFEESTRSEIEWREKETNKIQDKKIESLLSH